MEAGVIANFNTESIYAALRQVYPAEVAALTRFHEQDGVDRLPSDIWRLILSHCWRNTRTIMCVCKRWLALAHTPEYWRRAYTEKFCIFPADFPAGARTYFSTQVHTFDVDMFADFKQQVGWIFGIAGTRVIHFRRIEVRGNDFEAKIFFGGGHMYYSVLNAGENICVSKNLKNSNAFLEKTLYSSMRKYAIMVKQSNVESCYFEEIDWINKNDDLRWRGTGYANDANNSWVFPQGDGTWSRLSTGEVLLQGKGVAWRGHMDDDGVTFHRGKRIKVDVNV